MKKLANSISFHILWSRQYIAVCVEALLFSHQYILFPVWLPETNVFFIIVNPWVRTIAIRQMKYEYFILHYSSLNFVIIGRYPVVCMFIQGLTIIKLNQFWLNFNVILFIPSYFLCSFPLRIAHVNILQYIKIRRN